MSAIQGTIKHGEVVLDRPADLPEGHACRGASRLRLPGRRWACVRKMRPHYAEGHRRVAEARMDEIEPGGWLTPEEEAAWLADLREQKEQEKARFFADC